MFLSPVPEYRATRPAEVPLTEALTLACTTTLTAFAPLTAAVVPFLVLTIAVPRPRGARAIAETVAGAALIASAGYIAINESFANWQAVWFCAGVAILGVILLRARDVPDSK